MERKSIKGSKRNMQGSLFLIVICEQSMNFLPVKQILYNAEPYFFTNESQFNVQFIGILNESNFYKTS